MLAENISVKMKTLVKRISTTSQEIVLWMTDAEIFGKIHTSCALFHIS